MTSQPVHSRRTRSLRVLLLPVALVTALVSATALQAPVAFGPGARVLLDAHNAYPYEGKWQDRIDRALATGLPLAIEQDLIWRVGADGRGTSVVAHDLEHAGEAPTFESHFFERIRPIMEEALASGPSPSWPVVVLNLDLKTDEPEHHQAIWDTLGTYEHWLTTAPRTCTPDKAEALTPGPLLVLTGLHPAQAARFHDAVPVGERLRVFGAIDLPQRPGADGTAQAVPLTQVPADTLIAGRASNYRRWVNFPWGVVEAGGPQKAGEWTPDDRQRLQALVDRAHAMDLWIRFYTLNGHDAAGNQGWHAGYNFGSLAAAQVRWRAARDAGVDFIATDQYEAFAADR